MSTIPVGALRFTFDDDLHLEQPATHSKLFPRAIDPANVLMKLKQLVKPIDPHPLVVETGHMASLTWTVTSSALPIT
jgi:hypothetical protein